MKISYLILAGICSVSSPLFARDKIDVLVMNNGDRFTCEIKGLESGVLYIGLDYVEGTVQVDWAKVNRVESKQLFLVTTEDGRNYVGALSMEEAGASRRLRIGAADEAANVVMVRHAAVVRMNQTSKNLWQRFDGSINSGFT